MFLALSGGARWVTQRDPQLLRIVLRSATARAAVRPRQSLVRDGAAECAPMTRVASDHPGLSRRRRDERSSIPRTAFVDDAVFLTKSGDLGVVLALDGVDYECLDPQQREAVTTRFEVALRLWDERTRLSQYVLKRNRVARADDAHPHPAVDALLRRRHAHLQAHQAALFTVSLYLVVLVEAEPSDDGLGESVATRALVSPSPRAASGSRRPARSCASTRTWSADGVQLRHKVDAFVQQLEDTVARACCRRRGVHVLPAPPELRRRTRPTACACVRTRSSTTTAATPRSSVIAPTCASTTITCAS